MLFIKNKYRGAGIVSLVPDIPSPSTNIDAVSKLLSYCPAHAQTPLVNASSLAGEIGIASLFIKDERPRMGLGSFKALGAAYVIACDAETIGGDLSKALVDQTYVTASAGNHGMSVAAGAKVFGANAVIYLSKTVPASFAKRLEAKSAKIVIEGDNYEDSMRAATKAAELNGWRLLSDSSWDGYTVAPHRLMEGYLQMAAEAFEQMPFVPTHVIVQAGVGGMAGAVAALTRKIHGNTPTIIVIEPVSAPALYESIKHGKPVATTGPVSNMGRLDCKEPSLIALKGLANDADFFVLITEQEGSSFMEKFGQNDLATSPSGGAGISFLLSCQNREEFGIDSNSRILTVLSEGADS